MLRAVAKLKDPAGAAAGRDRDPLAECVIVVRGVLREVYPGLRLAGAADDEVMGLGGVRGVQQGLVAGPGWGRVGSWDGLEQEVTRADRGAGAVVLLSYAGGRVGHAVALYMTDEGLRWVDPAREGDDAVRRDPPAVLEGAVAAWAVVVGQDGRVVAAPGEWSAPESAGAVGAWADAPGAA